MNINRIVYFASMSGSYKLIILMVLLVGSIKPTWSQNREMDSLRSVWGNVNEIDTVRLRALQRMSLDYALYDYDSAIYYGQKLLDYAIQNKLKVWEIRGNNSMGGFYMGLEKFDQGFAYFEKALKLLEGTNYFEEHVMILLNQAGTFSSANQNQRALEIYQNVQRMLQGKVYPRHLSGTYLGLGRASRALGNLEEAYDYYLKALKIREADPSLIKKLPGTYNSIGITCWSLGKKEEAKAYYIKSSEVCLEIADSVGLGNVYSNLGLIYNADGDTTIAMSYYLKALDLCERQGNLKSQSKVLNNIANLHSGNGNRRLGHVYYEKSAQVAKEGGHLHALSVALLNDAMSYDAEENYPKALKLSIDALEKANEAQSINVQKNAHNMLYHIYYAIGDYKNAADYLDSFHELDDSLADMARVDEIAKLELEYAYEKKTEKDSVKLAEQKKVMNSKLMQKKAELREKDANERNQKNVRYGLLVGLILVLVFAVFMFNRFRLTNKQKKIIESQSETVSKAYESLEEKNTEIMDSIHYAKRIQDTILPTDELFTSMLPNSFVMYRPKDIVAGDFYWLHKLGDQILFAAADCTGHGVPGAMVSVVCSTALNKSVKEFKETAPSKILDRTRDLVIESFAVQGDLDQSNTIKDGMDIALCSLNGLKLTYSGAHNPLWIIRSHAANSSRDGAKGVIESTDFSSNVKLDSNDNCTLIEVKADKQPIGQFDAASQFTMHSLDLIQGDTIYIFSDGYADQFGGEKGKKFKTSNMKKLLMSMQDKSMLDQKNHLETTFQDWSADYEQLDDICIIGVRV